MKRNKTIAAQSRKKQAASSRKRTKRAKQQAKRGGRRQERKERVQERREVIRAKANEETELRGRPVRRGDIFKIVGLVAFVAIIGLLGWLLWPYIHTLFEPGGINEVINDVRNAGPLGFLILLALQFLQIVDRKSVV